MVKERKQKERRLLEKVREDSNGGFARALASNDWATRERGLQALTLWLSGHRDIQEKDLLRLWKALFYCFWHSDKVPVQTALAERLSEIMGKLPPAIGRLYFCVFVRTMRREWFGIDRHRMDKFMMLVRKFYAQHLRFLAATGWDAAQVFEFAEFWRAEVLLPTDTLAAAGFAYHIADLVLPELGRVAAETGTPPPAAAVDAILEPFCAAAAATRNGVMIRRLSEGLWLGIAAELRAPSDGDALRKLDAAALAERLFDLGAKQETRAANREALYAASKEIEAAAAQRGKPAAKKAKKQKTATAAEAQEQQAAAVAEEKPAKKAGSKKRKAAEEAEALAPAETPVAEKPKGKKAKAAAAAETPTPAAVAAAGIPAAAAPNGVDSSGKKKKKKKAKSAEAEDAWPSAAAAAVAAAVTPASQPRNKSVRFSLKRNLVNVIGQPPLPEDVRTPPTARPKGSALKVRGPAVRQPSLLGRKPAGAAAPASAPPKVGGSRLAKGRSPVGTRSVTKAKSNAPRTLPSPGSVPRPKAAEFF